MSWKQADLLPGGCLLESLEKCVRIKGGKGGNLEVRESSLVSVVVPSTIC